MKCSVFWELLQTDYVRLFFNDPQAADEASPFPAFGAMDFPGSIIMKRLLLLLIGAIWWSQLILADHDSEQCRFGKPDIRPNDNALFSEICGDCHFAYQPGLLPSRSWKRLLSPDALKNHFDEEIELSDTERNAVTRYLVEYSADHSRYKRSRKIKGSIPQHETPIRITATRYIKRKHREIPIRLIKDNDKVESLSNCDVCHKEAGNGIYDDDTVAIPNYGRWDD